MYAYDVLRVESGVVVIYLLFFLIGKSVVKPMGLVLEVHVLLSEETSPKFFKKLGRSVLLALGVGRFIAKQAAPCVLNLRLILQCAQVNSTPMFVREFWFVL